VRLALILVHYHTPDLAVAAVEALRAGVGDRDAEWILVDNGSDDAGRAALERLPVRLINPGANLGYAGGVNLGVASSTAEALIVMNPDVLVFPGCVPALLDRLQAGAAVAGPAFWWDRGRRMLLPPAEERSRTAELLAVLSPAAARRRWRRHARRHWEARGPLASWSLSGSLLAIRRDAWDRVGPFDEGYRLFFEETDWLLRARRLGLRSEYVPAAEAVHLYNQSAVREPRSQTWFEESARRFRRLHYGAGFSAVLERLSRRNRKAPDLPRASVLDLPEGAEWVEVSPSPDGFPAAAEHLGHLEGRPAPWRLPEEIAGRMPGGRWIVQVTDRAGRELLRSELEAA
jgi:N-acetylglucosaminyl-diphospho-decaprenol L-rhamnosyltransferase